MGQCCLGGKQAETAARNDERDDQTATNEEPENVVGARQAAVEFSYSELQIATDHFRGPIIGDGCLGLVYRGKLQGTGQLIAVKSLHHPSVMEEFREEIHKLSLLRHPNIVNLIGYYAQEEWRYVVYEFMPYGSLESHIHGGKRLRRALDWDKRMKIAAGVAKGLSFLHNEVVPPMVYGNLKSSNILLGRGFHPKISDLGLEKLEDRLKGATTAGYYVPEYAATGNLTIKSDVYSFGVILFELLSGYSPIDILGEDGIINRAREWLDKSPDNLYRLVDAHMEKDFSLRGLKKLVELALMCVEDDPNARPNLKEVADILNTFTVWVRVDGHMPTSPVLNLPQRGETTFERGESSTSTAQATFERGESSTSAISERGEASTSTQTRPPRAD